MERETKQQKKSRVEIKQGWGGSKPVLFTVSARDSSETNNGSLNKLPLKF